ncbi:cobaltochelatase subunit CobN [Nitrospira sp. Kam-Ns4a]
MTDRTGPEILILTTADTDILALDRAVRLLPEGFPKVRARNLAELQQGGGVGRTLDGLLGPARIVVARVLGGRAYFHDELDLLAQRCRGEGRMLLALPGDRELDPDLTRLSTVPLAVLARAAAYLAHGGVDNLAHCLRFLADALLGTRYGAAPPAAVPDCGRYASPGPPVAAPVARIGLLFYRAHWMAGNLEPVDALVQAIRARGAEAVAVFCPSLKETDETGMPLAIREHFLDRDGRPAVDAVISTLAFTMAQLDDRMASAFARLDVPVIQATFSTGSAEAWRASSHGLSPRDLAMSVALPEFDGRIISAAVSFKERAARSEALDVSLHRYRSVPDRVDQVAALALNWARLRRLPNHEKRVAILFGNYPSKNARIGNGVGLDTPASVLAILRRLAAEGYDVGALPESGDALMHALIDRCTQDEEFVTAAQLEAAVGTLADERYCRRFAALPASVQAGLAARWGAPPGRHLHNGRGLAIPGLLFGKVFVGIQPARGYGQDSAAIYHSPDLPPTHFYLGYYQWIREVFGADAVIHVGKHGNLEWLPGKSLALSASCYPEIALGPLPNLYPYIINNPGEGTQAKRRAHAVIVDHLIPPMTRAETYGDLLKLEQLMDEYYQVSALNPEKRPIVVRRILELVQRSEIYRDLNYAAVPAEEELDRFLTDMDGYLCQIKESQIRGGLHVLGRLPSGEALHHLLVALVRLDQGDVPGLLRALAEDLGLDYRTLLTESARPAPEAIPPCLQGLGNGPCRSQGDLLERLEQLALRLVAGLEARGFVPEAGPDLARALLQGAAPRTARALAFLAAEVWPRLARVDEELVHLLRGLAGRFVPAGPSGAPTRGMATILPTGRNFYSVDIRTIPSESAWEVGQQAAQALLERHRRETGAYPASVGIVVWGTSNMRTGGDDIAEILALLGVRPRWQGENRRVVSVEVIPLAALGRPRVDVTVRISGFFRDAFPNVIRLLDEAFRTVAALPESPEENYVRAHVLETEQRLAEREPGLPAAERARRARYRIFGSKPGAYGAGLLPLIDERNWKTDEDLARVYITWGGYAFTAEEEGVEAFTLFEDRLAAISVAVQNQDNREHDLFDSDDYFQYQGGMIATVRALTGRNPAAYHGDTSRPDLVKVRDLKEECARVFRSRVVNPKWIRGMMQHGFKGAFEMAATVDYLFGYDATAHVIPDWMYTELAKAYLLDPEVQRFLAEVNPWALRGMAERLLEAADRELWEAPPEDVLGALRDLYLDLEGAGRPGGAGGGGEPREHDGAQGCAEEGD